jgi:hypothetical protein
MKYLYILLTCLILFYLISRYFEKYYSQENFDPSLVPVSSIITLAKVAQKIVDGNGTLTNPANLNIGTPSAVGNLLVTGDSTTNGNSTVGDSLFVDKDTSITGNLGVAGSSLLNDSRVTGSLNVIGYTKIDGATTPGATSLTVTGNTKINGATTLGATSTPAATTSLTVNGATAITGNTTVGGATTFNGENTFNKRATLLGGSWTKGTAYVAFDGTYNTLAITPTSAGAVTLGSDIFEFKTSNIGNGTNVKINGGLTVTNALTAGSLNIVPAGSIMMWNGPNIPTGWVLCNGQNGTPDMQDRLIQGGKRDNNGGSSIETGKGTAGLDDNGKNRNSSIYTINFIMKT